MNIVFRNEEGEMEFIPEIDEWVDDLVDTTKNFRELDQLTTLVREIESKLIFKSTDLEEEKRNESDK